MLMIIFLPKLIAMGTKRKTRRKQRRRPGRWSTCVDTIKDGSVFSETSLQEGNTILSLEHPQPLPPIESRSVTRPQGMLRVKGIHRHRGPKRRSMDL